MLQKVASPSFRDLIPQAVFPHGEWVATRLNVFVQCYNTRLVPKDEVPTSLEALLDPKWKGRLGIEANDADWFQTVVKDMGEQKGLALFRRLVATNGVSVRKGHALLAELVTSGEIAFSLTCYSFKIDQDRQGRRARGLDLVRTVDRAAQTARASHDAPSTRTPRCCSTSTC